MDIQFADGYAPMSKEKKEHLYKNAPELGNYVCRQCNKCLPCPEGIDIPKLFKLEGYFDRQMANGTVNNTAEYALKRETSFLLLIKIHK